MRGRIAGTVLVSVVFLFGCVSCSFMSGQAEKRHAPGKARTREGSGQLPKKTRMIIATPAIHWGIDTTIAEQLKAEGVDLVAYPDCPKIKDPSLEEYVGKRLLDYNILIFGDHFYHRNRPDPETGKVIDEFVHLVGQMKKFLEGGGGIWFCGIGEQNQGTGALMLNYLLRELDLDAEVVGEVVMDTTVMKQGERFGKYSWAEIADDPLAEGVKNLLHPTGVISSEGSMGVVPIVKMGPEWRMILRGSETSASFGIDNTPPTYGNKLAVETPGKVKSRPVLCAVRQAGRGRVVLWPTWTNFTITGGSFGKLVDGEQDGKKSDGARLMKNLLYWLAEPSQNSKTVGLFDPDKYHAKFKKPSAAEVLSRWCKPGRKDYANTYKGLIGAHSTLSDGKNTPEEMIAAAKAAGYDFMAFTEDLSRMDEAKWKQLLAACDKANEADRNFRVFPGLDFVDEADNRGVVFGHRYWVTEKLRSKKFPDRPEYWYSFAYKSGYDPKEWPPRIIIRSKTNNKRPWYQGMWSFFAAYCYESGKLVDDSFNEYQPLVGPYFFDYNTSIAAVHTVYSTDDVKAAANPEFYQCYVRADQLIETKDITNPKGVYDSLWTNCGPWKPDPETDRLRDYYPHYFPSYVSTGPEIRDLRMKYLGGGMGADLAIEGNNRSMLHIMVHADKVLDEVRLYDGETLVRKYKPNAKDFEHFMVVPNNTQHAYVLIATDKAGGRAVSWPAWSHISEFMHVRCGDNWNYNTKGKGRSGGKFELRYGLFEVTAGWGSGPKKTDKPARPVYGNGQAIAHYAGPDSAVYYIWPTEWLVDDKPWQKAGGRWPILIECATAGPYGNIATNKRRFDYVEKNPISYTTLTFAGPYKITPTPWAGDMKYIVPFCRWNGAKVIDYQGTVTFTRKVATRDGRNLGVSAGGDSGNYPDILEVCAPGGKPKFYDAGKTDTISMILPLGAYACWYDAKGDGIGGLIVLSEGIRLTYTKKRWSLGIGRPSPADPMDQIKWHVVFFQGTTATSNSNEQMLDLWQGMGFNGKPTLYEVKPKVGKVGDQRLFLTLHAEDGGFRGRITRTTRKLLPIHLPVWVKGLNRRWDAGIWYKGRTKLEAIGTIYDKWGMNMWATAGRTEPRVNEVRYLPVLEDGTGYCQIETDKQAAGVFIGNFLVCDQPEVFLGLVKAEKGKCEFEINNPTDKELTCTVRPARGFELTGAWQKTITLPAGGYKIIAAGQ